MTAQSNNLNFKIGRRAIREVIFKLLFISGFWSAEDMLRQTEIYFEGVGSDGDFTGGKSVPSREDVLFINEKFKKALEKISEIDTLLNNTSKGWKTSRMNKVDLAVLRLAAYEMLYDENIPVSVAINEAVEIAKKFGGADSASFVNGILGKIAKQRGSDQ